MPLIRVRLHKIVGRSSWRVSDVSGIDEHGDHHRNLLLRNQVIQNIERRIVAVPVDVSAAILEDHQRSRRFRIILCRNINPVFTLHAVIDLAGVFDFFRQRAGWNGGLQIRKGTERRQVQLPAERRAIDHVVKRVQPSHRLDPRGRVPEIGAGQVLHRGPGSFVNDQGGL